MSNDKWVERFGFFLGPSFGGEYYCEDDGMDDCKMLDKKGENNNGKQE